MQILGGMAGDALDFVKLIKFSAEFWTQNPDSIFRFSSDESASYEADTVVKVVLAVRNLCDVVARYARHTMQVRSGSESLVKSRVNESGQR
jgi:hypothetical protein